MNAAGTLLSQQYFSALVILRSTLAHSNTLENQDRTEKENNRPISALVHLNVRNPDRPASEGVSIYNSDGPSQDL